MFSFSGESPDETLESASFYLICPSPIHVGAIPILLAADYNTLLVITSVLIAVLASYTALDLAARVTATEGPRQIRWLISGAAVMGTGVWSMHFIGMLAFRLPVLVSYDLLTVLISILPAMFASGIALFWVSRPVLGWLQLSGGSIFMGSGIASMHYIGMAAMHTPATIYYDYRLVALSILVAIAVSSAALFLVFRFRHEPPPNQVWKKILVAILMGAAIPTMHYIGMAAACFKSMSGTVPDPQLQLPVNALVLAVGVTIGTLIILGLTLLTAFFDRQLCAQIIYAQAIQDGQTYLKTILQGIQVGVLVLEDETHIRVSNQAVLDLLHFSTETDLQQWWNKILICYLDASPSDDLTDPRCHAMQPILEQVRAKQPVQNAVIYIRATPNHRPIALLVNTVPLELANTSTSQVIFTFNEVTELKQTERSLKESEVKFKNLAQQEELLNHLSTQIRQSLDLPTILQTAVSEVRKFCNTDRALIYEFNSDWSGQVILEDLAEPWIPTIGEAADNCFPEAYLKHYQDSKIRSINNTEEAGLHSAHYQFLQRLQVKANLIVPIMVRHQLWGLLIVHQCSHPRIWRQDEGALLHRLASQLGIAIQQSDLYTQTEQSALKAQAQAQQLRQSEAQLKQQAQDLQRTLEERQRLQLQLIQSEKMSSLGQLVAGVAHEINNPISFIYGNLPYIQDYTEDLLHQVQLYQTYYPNPAAEIQAASKTIDLDFLQRDLTKIVHSMQMGTERIQKIVLSLRNFSRMDEAEFKTVDIHEGIEGTLMLLQHRLTAASECPSIRVIRNYANLPLVECYPGQLNQVLMNILSNAVDALEDVNAQKTAQESHVQPSEIAICTSIVDEQWVKIAIADNGLGMSNAVRERIFDPFFTTKSVGKGIGMGLSISYQIIVERHGGKLECVSTPNQGTEFIIQIPVSHPVCHRI